MVLFILKFEQVNDTLSKDLLFCLSRIAELCVYTEFSSELFVLIFKQVTNLYWKKTINSFVFINRKYWCYSLNFLDFVFFTFLIL